MENGFTVGEKVYVVTRSYGRGRTRLTSISSDIVKTVTKAKLIVKLENHFTEFRWDGSPVKRSGFSIYSTSLERMTPDLAREVAILKIINLAANVKFEKLDLMTVEELGTIKAALSVFKE